MVNKIYNFQNCQSGVENLVDEEGKVVGRAFVIIDEEEHTVYRYAMPVEAAQIQGQRLMGIGNVELADNGKMAREVAQHQKRKP